MGETRLSVRVDSTVKRNAETVFNALGMNMSTGINIFLTRVARSRSIPFALELDSDPQDVLMRRSVRAKISKAVENGTPTALFDDEQNCPYLEYPDGRRVYDLD
ncbi:MAG: type II toxin-antitoxin system RelB/DinJ family antitoxin [Synergistaceae bacterium]|jgi:addiction module RelB/DinJ family antitoxin|nr:type II toxin-antitoxin system RelB/DinJ family antitoxin [Synergistaceae bacterium]